MTQGCALGYLPEAPNGAREESLGCNPRLPSCHKQNFPERDAEKPLTIAFDLGASPTNFDLCTAFRPLSQISGGGWIYDES